MVIMVTRPVINVYYRDKCCLIWYKFNILSPNFMIFVRVKEECLCKIQTTWKKYKPNN